MSDTQLALLLLSALACFYVAFVRTSAPVVRRCPRCGDLVQFTEGLPTRCPHCRALSLI